MKLYGAIDLHSTNSVTVVINEQDQVVYQKRLPNDLSQIAQQLSSYRRSLQGIVVESTYNWYWLVDGLMEKGYRVHLANTAAIQQYEGLKYTDDDSRRAMAGPYAAAGSITRGIHLSEARASGARSVAQAGPAGASQDGESSEHPEPDKPQHGEFDQRPVRSKRSMSNRSMELLPNPDHALAVKANLAVMIQRRCPDRDPGKNRPGPSQAAPSVQVS